MQRFRQNPLHSICISHGMSSSTSSSPRILWGLVTRKTRWGLSWRGRLAITFLVLLLAWTGARRIHPFLAITRRVDARVLVVEGWLRDHAMRKAVEEFKAGGYERVLTTGAPVQGIGGYLGDSSMTASIGASRLKSAGLAEEFIQIVPYRVREQDRTYSSAVALYEWLRVQQPPVRSINIVTQSAHARRTRLLFQKAMGDEIAVGIIAIASPEYDARHWWRYSDGVRDILGESIAYVYARIFFSPPPRRTGEKDRPAS